MRYIVYNTLLTGVMGVSRVFQKPDDVAEYLSQEGESLDYYHVHLVEEDMVRRTWFGTEWTSGVPKELTHATENNLLRLRINQALAILEESNFYFSEDSIVRWPEGMSDSDVVDTLGSIIKEAIGILKP